MSVGLFLLAGCGSAGPQTPDTPAFVVAHPTDDAGHPGSRTEWWYVHAVEPGHGRAVIVVFFSSPLAAIAGFLYTPTRMTHWTQPSLTRAHSGPGVLLAAGGIRYEESRRVWIVDQSAAGYRIHLTLSAPKPGITTGSLRFGNGNGGWTVPVATGWADGSISTPSGIRIAIRRWRAYHDHSWSSFDLESPAYRGWEWAAVHDVSGNAWVLAVVYSLGGRVTGALVHVTSTHTTACSPAIKRQHWTSSAGFRFPVTVRASCNGQSVTFRVLRPYVVPLGTGALSESIGRTDTPGSIGLIEHFARRQR